MYIQTEYTWYTTPKYQYWFRAILGRFSKRKNSKWDLDPPTHPPTHFHSEFGFLEFGLLCKACNPVHMPTCERLWVSLATVLGHDSDTVRGGLPHFRLFVTDVVHDRLEEVLLVVQRHLQTERGSEVTNVLAKRTWFDNIGGKQTRGKLNSSF